MIKDLGNHKARLIVNVGSGADRIRKTTTVTYKNKTELKRLYNEFEAEARRDPLTGISVVGLVEAYINKRKMLGVKPSTLVGYNATLKRLEEEFSGIVASELTTYRIEEYVTRVSYSASEDEPPKYAPSTVSQTIVLLSSAYKDAIRTGQLDHNPCDNVLMPKKKQSEAVVFSSDEMSIFLKALEKERIDIRVAFELCLLCGMRRCEALGLTTDDVDLEKGTVSITRSRHHLDGKMVVGTPKTARSRRTLALPGILVEDIKALIAEHNSYSFETSEYLIQDGFGQPLSPTSLSNQIIRIERSAGLPHVTVHGLRHTFASMLNSEQVDIARISAELGHSSITTTLSVYTHVFGGASASSRGIADMVNDRFSRSATQLPQSAK